MFVLFACWTHTVHSLCSVVQPAQHSFRWTYISWRWLWQLQSWWIVQSIWGRIYIQQRSEYRCAGHYARIPSSRGYSKTQFLCQDSMAMLLVTLTLLCRHNLSSTNPLSPHLDLKTFWSTLHCQGRFFLLGFWKLLCKISGGKFIWFINLNLLCNLFGFDCSSDSFRLFENF